MKKLRSLVGSAIFLVIAPGTIVGYVPWLISRWEFQSPFFGFAASQYVGLALIALGLPGLLDSFVRFAVQGVGTPAPIAPTEHLVVSGLYRYVRNPMYVSVLLLLFGQALLLGNAAILAYWALIWIAFHLFVCYYEEPTLRKRYSDEYIEYVERVPRWIPRLR